MGVPGPQAPPGSGVTTTGGGQPRLGQTGGGGNGGGSAGSGTGQEPTPMDMSLGPQPNQPMTASHGTVYLVSNFFVCLFFSACYAKIKVKV